MKNLKLLFTVLYLTICTCLNAQNSWVVKTPHIGQPYGMLKSYDNYIYMATKYITNTEGLDSIYLFKYTMQGELLIERALPSGYRFNMFQAYNGDIVTSYVQDSITKIYRFKEIDLQPDIIEVPIVLNSVIEGNGQYKYFILKVNNDTIYGIANDNSISLVLQTTYNNDNKSRARKLIKTKNGYFIRDNVIYEFPSYYLINNNLEILNFQKYMFKNELAKETVDGFILHCNFIPQFSEMGMVKLGANLDSLWSVPFSHYYQYGGDCFNPNDLIACADGGYAICGTMEWMERSIMYLIKTDAFANPLIVRDYWDYLPEGAWHLKEAPDGSFIMAQVLLEFGNHSTYLVRTNIDGSVKVNELGQKPNILVYPNPFTNKLNIEFPQPINQPYTISLYDSNGVLIMNQQKSDPASTTLDISDLSRGIYIISIINNNQTYNRMIFKK